MSAATLSTPNLLRNMRPLVVAGLLAVGYLVSNHGAASLVHPSATPSPLPHHMETPLASRAGTWVMATGAAPVLN